MISCEKARLISNKHQYKEASLLERINFKIHLLMCAACSVFAKKNRQLTHLCDRAQLQTLTEGEKGIMNEKLRQKF
jgi:hypothetical protein